MKANRQQAFRFVGSFTIAIALTFAMNASAVMAWSQLFNDFDIGGSGYCGGSMTYPCLFWQEAHWTSTTLNASIAASADSDNYSMTTAINRAFGDFNAAPAYNPYIYQCTSGTSCGTVAYYGSLNLGCGVWAGTSFPQLGAIEYTSGIGYYQFATLAQVAFNTASYMSWNNSLNYSYDASTCTYNADGRKVATHETGHVMSLGHTSYTAVMHQGAEPFFSLQSNDIQGLQAIYTGTSPSS